LNILHENVNKKVLSHGLSFFCMIYCILLRHLSTAHIFTNLSTAERSTE